MDSTWKDKTATKSQDTYKIYRDRRRSPSANPGLLEYENEKELFNTSYVSYRGNL